MRTTIHDVARAAGCSHQTVSNVLNGTGRVGDATRARVGAAVEALQYRAHAGAASLRTRRTGMLAYPLAAGDLGPMNTIMLEFIQALTAAASGRGHHLLLAPDGDLDALLSSGGADAVLLANITDADQRVATLAARGVPFATFGRTESDMPQSWVDIDSRAGVGAVTERLVRLGHTPVFLGYAPPVRWDAERETGYRDAMTAARLPARVTTSTPPEAKQAIDDLLSTGPTAIVCGSDVLASEVYAAATRHGLLIGTDLAVTGFDGSMVGRLLAPTLTTLAIPTTYVAERLVARAIAEIDGPTSEPGELVLPDVVSGESA